MSDDERTATAAVLLLLAAALVAWWLRGRRRTQRDSIRVPGVGRVWMATDEESEYWREQYAPEEVHDASNGPAP